jgi:hypothetical protein
MNARMEKDTKIIGNDVEKTKKKSRSEEGKRNKQSHKSGEEEERID